MKVSWIIRTTDAETLTIRVPEELRRKNVQITMMPCDDKADSTNDLILFDQLVEEAKQRDFNIDKNVDINALMDDMS